MATTKITDLTAYTDPVNTDVLPIVDVTSDVTKKVSIANVMKNASLGTAAAPGIAFDGDPNTGIYSPGADQVAISTNGTGRLFVDASGRVGVGSSSPDGLLTLSGGGFNFSEAGGTTRSINWRDSTAQVTGVNIQGSTSGGFIAFGTAASGGVANEKLRITSAGLVGIGTSAVTNLLHLRTDSASAVDHLFIQNRNGGASSGSRIAFSNGVVDYGDNRYAYIGAVNTGASQNGNNLVFATNVNGDAPVERMRLTATGLGIGTSTPGYRLHCVGDARFESSNVFLDDDSKALVFGTGTTSYIIGSSANNNIRFVTNSSERGRWDSSGRLLVGTSSAFGANYLQIQGDQSLGSTGIGAISLRRGAALGSMGESSTLGRLEFGFVDGGVGAQIAAFCDAASAGTNDYPGRLVFSTTADGASSPTERCRLDNSGRFTFQRGGFSGNPGYTHAGVSINDASSGALYATRDGAAPGFYNRLTNDGNLVEFAQDNVVEGTISVSGTTVSYNGAHLSRWSQLPSGQERVEILRGSVLSNIDEMCEWTDEENEQLNRMKVSDVEGDKNVSGVFQAWDDDDDTYTNDFYCAMTGDFIIRIAEGVTVERGDLLMSAGDGTAKPQDDDIIRSKTIAKVTSTNVSCTYADGSYCVPCVLMAC